MHTYRKYIGLTNLTENTVMQQWEILDSGGCQCFKDCDCSKRKGKFMRYEYNFYNKKLLNKQGTAPRNYSQLESLRQALKQKNIEE